MYLDNVLQHLRSGGSISRKNWVNGSFVCLDMQSSITRIDLHMPGWLNPLNLTLTADDILADDWFIINE
jgi:hypothetical protein